MKILNSLLNANINQSFFNIADYLMNKVVIVSNIIHKSFRITELEFYLYKDGHEDNSTHCNFQQKSSNKFYFHKFSNSSSYKQGNRKGLDITFGNDDSYGGILIRSIKEINGPSYIYGPSRTVDKLISDKYIKDRLEIIESKQFDKIENPIYCKELVLEEKEIYKCPRVNLPKHTKEEYILKYYRYFCFPTFEHKGKHSIIRQWMKDNYKTFDESKKIFNYKNIKL